ncbi:uncharacterized protein LOC124661033 [Lolium rigidum]|uniref:uncharacterized protein LOC124661033 n=1 Tax=Lolium rigidum TaxID=89674 RepID=UPI001F5CCFA8|nr:uncharacterized protein LOC124661033 [Lolium rigidum]
MALLSPKRPSGGMSVSRCAASCTGTTLIAVFGVHYPGWPCLQVNERKGTIKFQLNKVLCIGVAMSNLSLWEKQIQLNIEMSINFRFGKMSPRILVWCVGSSMVSPSLAAIVLHSLMSPGREDVAAVLLLDLGRP